MFFFQDEKDSSAKLDAYGNRSRALYQLAQNGIATPRAFALSMNEFWGDQELLDAVHRIGGFPVTISLGASSSVNYFVDFHSFDGDRDLAVNRISELRHEIRTLSELYAKQSASMSRYDKRSFSLLIQQKIDYEYFGSAYSLDPYLGREDIFLVEIFTKHPSVKSESYDSIPHQYSVNYFTHKVETSEVGTGYVNFTNDLVAQFSQSLIQVQELMGAPQKIKFGVDRAGKLWITHLKNTSPILFGAGTDRYVAMDYFDPNNGFEVYTPLMFGLIESSIEDAIKKIFTHYHPKKQIASQRFGRCYLSCEALEELLHLFPSHYRNCLFQALEIKHHSATGKKDSFDLFQYLQQFRIRMRQRKVFRRFLSTFDAFSSNFLLQEIKYKAYAQQIDTFSPLQLHQHFQLMLEEYFIPVLSNHYLFCLLEISARAELIDCLSSVGLEQIIDKDFLSGIGENSMVILQNKIIDLAGIFQQHGASSEQYRLAKKKFLEEYYYQGIQTRDLLAPRWEEDFSLLESFFSSSGSSLDQLRHVDCDLNYSSSCDALLSRLYSLHPVKRVVIHHRAESVINDFKNLYAARRQLHDYFLRSLYHLRLYLIAIEKGYIASGILEHPGQIFFMQKRELLDSFAEGFSPDNLAHIKIREKLFLGVKSFTPPRNYGAKDVSMLTPKTPSGAAGIISSPGEVRGKVLFLKRPEDILKADDQTILVASDIDSGLAFIACKVKAVILEHGNTMSQLSSLCRRNKIPMIIRVKAIDRQFKDGDSIVVNATSGEISLVEPR